MKTGWQRVALVALIAALLALIWVKPVDGLATRNIESGLQRSLTTFAAARGLNALLSAVQSASVNVGVGLAGGAIHPGAVLEPIDDLVEQFSALMLAAAVSFAAQRLLIELFGTWPVDALLTVLLLGCAVFAARATATPRWLLRVTVVLLCTRLAVPLLAVGSEMTYRAVLADGYETSQKEIAAADPPELTAQAGDDSRLAAIKRWWSESTDVAKKIETLKARADGLVEHIVKLTAVFVVQTVVFPLLFLLALVVLYRTVMRGPP
jgi:hypothetical protein